MHVPEEQAFEFGGFTLVPRERQLLHDGKPVHLTAKAFDLLLALVRRAGHLVSKDELLREVWPDTFVEEVNLTVNISTLRKILDRVRDGDGMIKTVPKCGYRFVTPVTLRDVAVDCGQETRQLARQVTQNADAYRAYLQGRHDWNRRSEEGLRGAIERFQSAVEMDPRFAPAYSGLADSYATLGYLNHMSPAEAFPAARRYATKALELDPSLAEPHASMAFVKLYFDWDWSGADVDFRRAIALDPNYAPTHQWYSIYLLAAGRVPEALHEIQLARQRDSLSVPINSDLGFHYYYAGSYEEAAKQLKFVLEMNKDYVPAHLWLGRTYQELGRFEAALAEFRRVEESIPEWPVSIAARGFAAGIAGRSDEAREILADLKRLAARKFVTPYGVALVHAGLGENNAAFAWLNKAFDERAHWLVWLRLDPRWNGLRRDSRFSDLVSRMRFPR